MYAVLCDRMILVKISLSSSSIPSFFTRLSVSKLKMVCNMWVLLAQICSYDPHSWLYQKFRSLRNSNFHWWRYFKMPWHSETSQHPTNVSVYVLLLLYCSSFDWSTGGRLCSPLLQISKRNLAHCGCADTSGWSMIILRQSAIFAVSTSKKLLVAVESSPQPDRNLHLDTPGTRPDCAPA